MQLSGFTENKITEIPDIFKSEKPSIQSSNQVTK